jgi:hypothetical protein
MGGQNQWLVPSVIFLIAPRERARRVCRTRKTTCKLLGRKSGRFLGTGVGEEAVEEALVADPDGISTMAAVRHATVGVDWLKRGEVVAR